MKLATMPRNYWRLSKPNKQKERHAYDAHTNRKHGVQYRLS